ncbi:MAG: beta-galactosidase [Desulfobacterales bacterium]|nr:beta-galactosidase [Desulfobacterales bacterium]
MKVKFIGIFYLLIFLIIISTSSYGSLYDGKPYKVEVDKKGFKIDGDYKLLRGGSIQWFRLPEDVWKDRLKRFKAAGFNTVDMYVAWNVVEKEEGKFNFTNPDIKKFLDYCTELGLYVYLRPGPYICNEFEGGGLPAWLFAKTTKKSLDKDGKPNLRTNDPDYLEYVERYLDNLNSVIKPYTAAYGGPIILYSIENEYNWFEIFHEVDKLFWYDGGMERPWNHGKPTKAYLKALRDIITADGIDLPITSCPGDGKTTGMGDVPGIIPMPNVYIGMGGEMPEKIGYDLLNDMHNIFNHGGAYINYPTGVTETERNASRIKRMFMGGMDAVFAFNIAGMFQHGRYNSVVLNKDMGNSFDFSNVESILNGFVSPEIGYFHNVVDYDGAISPSGNHREKYYEFKRDNSFFNSVESYLAPCVNALRSGKGFSGIDKRLVIENENLGVKENNAMVHYWFDTGAGSYFIGIVNESGEPQLINKDGIYSNKITYPKYSSFTVPIGNNAGDGQFDQGDTSYSMILVQGYPIDGIGKINYTTSQLLTSRKFNNDNLIVVYGEKGYDGELSIDTLKGKVEILSKDTGISIDEQTETGLTVTYTYEPHRFAVFKTSDGKILRLIITTSQEAGRFWFLKGNDVDVMITGIDYIDSDSVDIKTDLFSFAVDYDETDRPLIIMAPFDFQPINAAVQTKAYDLITQTAYFQKPTNISIPQLPDALSTGKCFSDNSEANIEYDDSSWEKWKGEPSELEKHGIYQGYAWYRAELDLKSKPLFWDKTHLYIKQASDIIGIYVNGNYLTTLMPLGTEIDGESWNSKYKFPALRPYLKKGKNIIAFKTEIWGHGSFMWPRGILIGTRAQLPALGVDSVKGLLGKAKVGDTPLENWSIRANLGGEVSNYHSSSFDDSSWKTSSIPLNLKKGEVLWYRTTFDTDLLPNEDTIHSPVVLALKGEKTKATIYLNGEIIGRWLSGDGWIGRGFWGKATRTMWMNTDPDHFPIPKETLNKNNQPNILAIVFEDASNAGEDAGRVDKVYLEYSKENKAFQNGESVMISSIKGRQFLSFKKK